MMRWIIGSSLQGRLLVVAIAVLILFFGFTHLRNMPVEVLPEFSEPYVEIQTEASVIRPLLFAQRSEIEQYAA